MRSSWFCWFCCCWCCWAMDMYLARAIWRSFWPRAPNCSRVRWRALRTAYMLMEDWPGPCWPWCSCCWPGWCWEEEGAERAAGLMAPPPPLPPLPIMRPLAICCWCWWCMSWLGEMVLPAPFMPAMERDMLDGG
ncbi:hypothetical protein BJ912DRAFT_981644 [Pholiota molesta]|nr:hypothetical protein BJ912DRAFT_981644 [Pholiota molesta]